MIQSIKDTRKADPVEAEVIKGKKNLLLSIYGCVHQ